MENSLQVGSCKNLRFTGKVDELQAENRTIHDQNFQKT